MGKLDEFLHETAHVAFKIMEMEGEITTQIEADLQNLATSEKSLTDRYGFVLQQLEKEEEFAAAREDEFKGRRLNAARARDFLKQRLKHAMNVLHRDKIVGGYTTIQCVKMSPKVVITDEKKLPLEFMKIKTTEEPNKILIKQALDAGLDVPGVILEEVVSIRIQPSKPSV